MNPHLSFDGQCEAAFKFYEKCLAAQLGAIFRYAGTPISGQVPPEWRDKVMHGSLTVGEQVLTGGDVVPAQYDNPRGFSLSLQLTDTREVERIFHGLADGGRVTVPLEKTFWSPLFGMVVDRFGIPWLINCTESDQPPAK
jgi:PhnB protein